jgi:hypothetical protein
LFDEIIKVFNVNSLEELEELHVLNACKFIPQDIELTNNTHSLSSQIEIVFNIVVEYSSIT